ncbi:hypothetical protein FQN57_004304 [Myotisia sp. PD_48]|nr:hypothetical protein FQN57_004304 [Myotisia sp. PD_48]
MPQAPSIQLPVINLSSLTADTGKEVLDAAIKYGFLYIDAEGTGFSKEIVDSAFEMAQEFFASPIEEKEQVKITTGNRGWSGMHRETLDPEHQERGDFKEAFNFGEFKDGKALQPLPKSLVKHEGKIGDIMTLCHTLCNQVLTLLAQGLKIPLDWFSSCHDLSRGPSGSIFRMLYYPSIQSPASSTFNHGIDVRAGAHSDYGSVTLLFQRDGQPGLEILTPSNTWAAVPVRPIACHLDESSPPPILVNIGDLLSYWTCGLLKSTVHRVVFPPEQIEQGASDSRDRYSMAYFCHPTHSTLLVPVPSTLVDEQRRRNAFQNIDSGPDGILTAQDHLAARLAATYGGSPDEYHRVDE